MAVRSSEQGFTLIELLVALSVFAIGALALLRLNGFAVSTTADLDGRSMAALVSVATTRLNRWARAIVACPLPAAQSQARLCRLTSCSR